MSNNLNNKTLNIKEKKLVGVDKFIIDFSFLKGYIKKASNIMICNNNQAEFIQTRILLNKRWNNYFKVTNDFFYYIPLNNDESYFLDNFFLYDEFIFYKMRFKNYDENCNYVYSTVIHPFLFALNLSILLYFQDNRNSPYLDCIYSKYNFNYNVKGVEFSSTNSLIFKEKYDNLINSHNNVVKLNIQNFKNSITLDVFKKFVYKKYNIKWETLEIIINYLKTAYGDGNRIIPTLEFSPLHSYLTSCCILEGIIEEILDSSNIKIDIVSYDEDIYLFFDNFNDWVEIKFALENVLFKNKLELDHQCIELMKVNGNTLESNNNKKIKFSDFYFKLIEFFKTKKYFVSSREVFLDFLNKENLENPFYAFDINNVNKDEYETILNIVNSIEDSDYFKILDSNPKYFIRLFYLLDKEYSSKSETGDKNSYLLSKIVSKFQEYKYNSSIINDDYYLYYYLYNSFAGLAKNKIKESKFVCNIDPFYINFQNFVLNIYKNKSYCYFIKFKEYSSLKISHSNLVSSLMFFLRNQFILHNYNDCILIVSTLYDLIKKEITKVLSVKDYTQFIEFMNLIILPKYIIDPINIDDWKKINKFRNGLSSCHIGNNNEEEEEEFKLDDLEKSLKNIIDWIFKSKYLTLNNNFNRFLFCLEALVEKKETVYKLFNDYIKSSK